MQILLTVIHVIVCVFLILVVLLQSGRGGGMGAALGGASNQIFGGRGASHFLTRLTTGAAVVFFLTSLTLSMMGSRKTSVVAGMAPKTEAVKPAPQEKAPVAAPTPEETKAPQTAPAQ